MSRYGRYGLLVPMADPGGSQWLSKMVDQLSGAISRALQVQGSIAGMLNDPDATDLAAAVSGLEGSIATAWGTLVSAAHAVDQAQADEVALAATPPPDHSLYGTFWNADIQRYKNDVAAYTQRQLDATNKTTAARQYLADAKNHLADLLSSYNTTVSAAAAKVGEVRDAKRKAAAAALNEAGAVSDAHRASLQTQTFVAQQQLATVEKQSAAATAAVGSSTTPLLIAALVGVPVLGAIAWAFSRRKKSASVAGYRRRRRSRR